MSESIFLGFKSPKKQTNFLRGFLPLREIWKQDFFSEIIQPLTLTYTERLENKSACAPRFSTFNWLFNVFSI